MFCAAYGSVAGAQNISCTCRYQGEDYGLGESICLKSPNGMKMATCSMVLNNTSWKISNAPCPLTRLGTEPPDLMDAAPIVPSDEEPQKRTGSVKPG